MKKMILFLAIVFFLVTAGQAFAGPYLICDPPADPASVETYEVFKDGVLLADSVQPQADGSLKYDLVGIDPGKYEFTAKACNAAWGCSSLSNPYTSPIASQKPINLRMGN